MDGEGAEAGTPPTSAELLAELGGLKLRALQKRAKEMGVDEEKLDDAEGRSDIIALIVSKVEEAAAAEAQRVAALKEQLQGMKLRALQKRAEEVGVDEDKLDDAEERADVIELILEKDAEAQTEPEPGGTVALHGRRLVRALGCCGSAAMGNRMRPAQPDEGEPPEPGQGGGKQPGVAKAGVAMCTYNFNRAALAQKLPQVQWQPARHLTMASGDTVLLEEARDDKEWWKGRVKDGHERSGWFPKAYVAKIKPGSEPEQPTPGPNQRPSPIR